MRRDQLAHILRAAATIVEDGNILVIGSQSILGTYEEFELPDRAVASIEADLAFFNDANADKADRVDGVIGELSPFHQLHGIYGQGVEISTATLPPRWRERTIRFERHDTGDAHAYCLDAHDLVISKLIAGREKDLDFAQALIGAGLIDHRALVRRVEEVAGADTITTAAVERLTGTVDSLFH